MLKGFFKKLGLILHYDNLKKSEEQEDAEFFMKAKQIMQDEKDFSSLYNCERLLQLDDYSKREYLKEVLMKYIKVKDQLRHAG